MPTTGCFNSQTVIKFTASQFIYISTKDTACTMLSMTRVICLNSLISLEKQSSKQISAIFNYTSLSCKLSVYFYPTNRQSLNSNNIRKEMETNIEKNVFRFQFLTSYTSNNLNLVKVKNFLPNSELKIKNYEIFRVFIDLC